MSELAEILRAQTEAIARAFNAGHAAGYKDGFRDGIAEAQKILKKVLPSDSTQPQEKSA